VTEAGPDRGGAAVWLFSVGQTLVYAGSYYAFPALLPDLEAATGWSKTTLALGPTLAFLIMASLTVFTGRLVDRGLGGEMLIWGPVLAALGVLGMSLASTPTQWLLSWAVVGVAQAGCVYETLFAFLTRRLGLGARGAITRVTLVAGFAGTLAFPLGHVVGERFGGQGGMLVFAGLTLAALPCNLWAVRALRRRERVGTVHAPTPPGTLQVALRRPAFWGIAACFGLFGLNHGILITYVLELFADRGAGAGMAATAAACIGPSQVIGRLLFMVGEARVGNARATMLALGSVVAAGVLLWLAGLAPPLVFAFALAQGAGMGLMSILRPLLIADILGRSGFGAISGAVAISPILASAAAPALGALLLTLGGTGLVYASCLAMAVTGWVIAALLLRGRLRDARAEGCRAEARPTVLRGGGSGNPECRRRFPGEARFPPSHPRRPHRPGRAAGQAGRGRRPFPDGSRRGPCPRSGGRGRECRCPAPRAPLGGSPGRWPGRAGRRGNHRSSEARTPDPERCGARGPRRGGTEEPKVDPVDAEAGVLGRDDQVAGTGKLAAGSGRDPLH
jgi:MFS family permease